MVYIKPRETEAKNSIHPKNIIRADTYLLRDDARHIMVAMEAWLTPSSCVTPAGTSNELDVQNEWEENIHAHSTVSRYCILLQQLCYTDYTAPTVFLSFYLQVVAPVGAKPFKVQSAHHWSLS